MLLNVKYKLIKQKKTNIPSNGDTIIVGDHLNL